MYAIEGVILFILFYLAQVYTFEYKRETHGDSCNILVKCAGLFTLDQQGPMIALIYLHIMTTEFLINMYKFYRLGIYDSNNSISLYVLAMELHETDYCIEIFSICYTTRKCIQVMKQRLCQPITIPATTNPLNHCKLKYLLFLWSTSSNPNPLLIFVLLHK